MTDQIRRDGIRAMIQQATVVIIDGTSYRVDYCEPDYFCAISDDDGDEVYIEYEEVDLARDKIFKLVQMNA